MGAWGEKTFDDDTSMDLIEEWVASDNPEDMIAQAVKEALSMDYLEYTEGHVISVAAAILDYTLNDQPKDEVDVDGLDNWLSTLMTDRLIELKGDVLAGIDKLLGNDSELNELWAENEDLYPAWRQVIEDRKARLLVEP